MNTPTQATSGPTSARGVIDMGQRAQRQPKTAQVSGVRRSWSRRAQAQLARAGNGAQRLADKATVAGIVLDAQGEVVGAVLFGLEVIGAVPAGKLLGHGSGVCRLEALDSLQHAGHCLTGQLGVVVGLQVDPALRIGAEEGRQAQRRIDRDAALTMHYLVDAASRHADGLGQRVLTDAQGLEPVFQQDHAGAGQWNFSGHDDAPSGVHCRACSLDQEAAAAHAVALRVVVNPGQDQARNGDVDLVSRSEILLDRGIHHGPHAARIVGVRLMRGNGLARGQLATVFEQGFDVQINRFEHAFERILDAVATREAARQVGHDDAVVLAVIGVKNYSEFHGAGLLLLAPAGLTLNAVERLDRNVAVRVLDRHQAGLAGVLELVMRTFDAGQIPAVGFQLFDGLLAVHGGYSTYRVDNHQDPASPKDAHRNRARLCYSYCKPKGPMCEDIIGREVAAPTVKRGFVASEFVRHGIPMSACLGADGPYREAGRTALPVSSTSAHPLRVKALRVVLSLEEEPNP